MTAEQALPIICPKCHVALVRYQRFQTEDIVFCPRCGVGGGYRDVLEDSENLVEGFVSDKQIADILHELRLSLP